MQLVAAAVNAIFTLMTWLIAVAVAVAVVAAFAVAVAILPTLHLCPAKWCLVLTCIVSCFETGQLITSVI